MTSDHEYMDTGALTEDAVPNDEQPPVEAPSSPAKKATAPTAPTTNANASAGDGKPDSALPSGAHVS